MVPTKDEPSALSRTDPGGRDDRSTDDGTASRPLSEKVSRVPRSFASGADSSFATQITSSDSRVRAQDLRCTTRLTSRRVIVAGVGSVTIPRTGMPL